LLVGDPAVALAGRHGLPLCPPEALVTEGARRHWAASRVAAEGTVGAVACDGRGHVAAATSTGGMFGKRPGRVGDSAVIGAGTYADDLLGAGSATGPGEAIIRGSLVGAALAWMRRGLDPAWVAQHALAELERRLGVAAGLILVDPAGRIGIAYTTVAMPAPYRTTDVQRSVVVAGAKRGRGGRPTTVTAPSAAPQPRDSSPGPGDGSAWSRSATPSCWSVTPVSRGRPASRPCTWSPPTDAPGAGRPPRRARSGCVRSWRRSGGSTRYRACASSGTTSTA